MHLGFGLYRHQLDQDHFRFARQCGATHLVVHYCDYFNQGGEENTRSDQPTGGVHGWGRAGDPNKLWSAEELTALRVTVEESGLKLYAIENFDPAHWHDVLLDGPKKAEQLEKIKTLVRTVGKVGIPVIAYNFSLAGVSGRVKGPHGRGGAEVVGMEGPYDKPIPNGMIWNMVYDRDAAPGELAPITTEELWRRHGDFLDAIVPVAEEAGVILAAHPDDPPTPTVRNQPRLVNQPALYQKLIDRKPSRSNALEFCLGTLAEMTDGDLYEAVDSYSSQHKIAYIHFRNVRGKAPHYWETFIDEGDIDMLRVLRILRKNGYDGVLIPDHAPAMTCSAPWYSGMAYACGWMKAAIHSLDANG
jgi:mannonate dehydratase